MKKIRRGDKVIAIAGKDKGKSGVVLTVVGEKLIVEGLGVVKKHTKGNPNTGVQGGILTKSLPIHHSNVMVLDTQNQKPSRVGVKILEDGSRVRYLKSSKEVLDVIKE
jgi:large subunit ribosomal protein L24